MCLQLIKKGHRFLNDVALYKLLKKKKNCKLDSLHFTMKWNESYSIQAEGKIHHTIMPFAKEIL